MHPHDKKYDSIVIGAGHAGAEAALAIARSGYQVLFLTMSKDAICQMSCNPAIGGLAKGHMVREIDALGGEMGLAIDHTAIQFRMLNRSKGPAVWAPRAQADKKQYRLHMTQAVNNEANIHLVEDQATELITKANQAIGVRTGQGAEYLGETVVVTTGTFMRGLIHVGEQNFAGGRRGELPSLGLSDSLREAGFGVVRFKTGTPCRLRERSINFSACQEQKGDEFPEPFSFRTKQLSLKQESCWLTFTNSKTHDIVRNNLHLSPLYAGRIKGVGPRYCPSIEDKVVKFADKGRHQIYLEPEGAETEEIYVNGLSTSLPKEVQAEFIHSIPGLEQAEILRFGYAIEYDCMPPTQLKHSLETKRIKNLFFAGQVNCTSGYEEAAAQGLMAGLNVIKKLKRKPAFVLDRSEAYIGVLIDDLVTRGTNEPYRMFTSRAEFRLLLRQDNANERLMKYGKDFGLVRKEIFEEMERDTLLVRNTIRKLKETKVSNASLAKWLRRTGVNINTLPDNDLQLDKIDISLSRKVEWDVKYEGYVSRQAAEIRKFKQMEKRLIPEEIQYEEIVSLSREAREKLLAVRPRSIGQALRIPGINSCDISVLMLQVKRLGRESQKR